MVQKVNFLEKIALRAPGRQPMTIETQDFSPWLLKSEDPAKMTYDLVLNTSDFVSRNNQHDQSSNILPILREPVANIQYQYLESLKSIFS